MQWVRASVMELVAMLHIIKVRELVPIFVVFTTKARECVK